MQKLMESLQSKSWKNYLNQNNLLVRCVSWVFRFRVVSIYSLMLFASCSLLYSQTSKKYWVFFVDKGPAAPRTGFLSRHSTAYELAIQTINPRALARRSKVLPPDALVDVADLPVCHSYLEQVVAAGGVLKQQSRWLNAASFILTSDVTSVVRELPCVKSIAPVVVFHRAQEHNVTEGRSYSLTKIASLDYGPSYTQIQVSNVFDLHNMGITGKGVLVGMLDSGFRWRVQESLRTRHVIAEHDFIFNRDSTANGPGDDIAQDFHGTLTMSVLGGYEPGQLIGPAFDADFILAKTELIYPSLFADTDTKIEEDNWAAGIEWMEAHGADVVSSSLGYNDFTDSTSYTWAHGDFNGRTTVSARAAVRAAELGVVVCNAMGNEGNGDGITGTVITPADADSIISVGAVDFNRNLAYFSSTGPTNDGRIKPDIVAPGVGVYGAYTSASNAYLYSQGTSLSTPLVAGSAALMLSVRPELTPIQVRDALRNVADPSDAATYPTRPNNFTGWGSLDALNAALSFGPIFSNTPTISSFDSLSKVTIYSASQFGLLPSGVVLRYAIGSDTNFLPVAMQLDSSMLFPTSGRFSAGIPRQTFGTIVRFYVNAQDSAGNFYRSPAPIDGGHWQFYYGDTGVVPPATVPFGYKLYQNYPNPFNYGTAIMFDLPHTETVSLEVYNVLGQLVSTLINGIQHAGDARSRSAAVFDGANLPSGVYFYRFTTPSYSTARKMLLIR